MGLANPNRGRLSVRLLPPMLTTAAWLSADFRFTSGVTLLSYFSLTVLSQTAASPPQAAGARADLHAVALSATPIGIERLCNVASRCSPMPKVDLKGDAVRRPARACVRDAGALVRRATAGSRSCALFFREPKLGVSMGLVVVNLIEGAADLGGQRRAGLPRP
jgi:hypothetical protein